MIGNDTGCRTAAMVEPLLLTSGLVRCEATGIVGQACGFLFAIATVFQLYHGGEIVYKMRRESLSLHFYRLKQSLTSSTI